MFKQFLNQVQGADVFMIMSFLLFFAVFIIVAVFLATKKKNSYKEISELPLND